jgi:hypothetical protein
VNPEMSIVGPVAAALVGVVAEGDVDGREYAPAAGVVVVDVLEQPVVSSRAPRARAAADTERGVIPVQRAGPDDGSPGVPRRTGHGRQAGRTLRA